VYITYIYIYIYIYIYKRALEAARKLNNFLKCVVVMCCSYVHTDNFKVFNNKNTTYCCATNST